MFRAFVVISIIAWLGQTASVSAVTTCCVCMPTTGQATTCLQVDPLDSGVNCPKLPQKFPKLASFTCVAPSNPGNCAPAGTASSVCTNGPTDVNAYTPPAAPAQTKPIQADAPKLNVQIPGLEFASNVTDQGGYIYIPFFAQYISAVYRYLVGISAVAAAIMIAYGGFLYIFAETGAKVRSGKDIITDALLGLFLLLAVYTILATLNPETLSFKTLRLQNIRAEPWHGDQEGQIPAGMQGKPITLPVPQPLGPDGKPLPPKISTGITFQLPKAICTDSTSCKKLCNGAVHNSDLPSSPFVASAADLVPIPKSQGLSGTGQLRKEAVDALVLAGQVAQTWTGGPYTLKIISTARSLEQQVDIACGKYYAGLESDVGPNVTFPGGSIHGSGVAIDLELWKDDVKQVACCDVATQNKITKEENAKILQEIMGSVGWVRYCKEVWHFEWGTDGQPARSKTCAWPPS